MKRDAIFPKLSRVIFFVLAAVLPTLFIYQSCRRPDQVGPTESWCTAGINILTVDDNNIPATVKTQIYSAPPGYTAVGTAGYNPNLPLVIIPFQFSSSLPFNSTVSAAVIRDNFFTTGTGSVHDYFSENSWGQYNIREGSISAGVTLYNNEAYYSAGQLGGDWTRNPVLARDICQNSNVNWASIDANGDRVINRNEAQICFMVSAGGGGATRPSSISILTNSGNYTINASFVFFDCKRNDDPTKGTDDIRYNYSTIWHELSHGMFGLPDRYTDYCGSGKTGQYDIMSDNCSWRHMTIYDKMKIGWIRPRILAKPANRPDGQRHCFTFPATETTPAALILWDANQPNEYWVVENRHKASSARNFDRDLPESGLAIWWVNEATDTLYLVDARDLSKRPQNYMYAAGTDQRGVLFKNRSGTRDSTYDMQFLTPSYNSPSMAIRAVSPEGVNMNAEF